MTLRRPDPAPVRPPPDLSTPVAGVRRSSTFVPELESLRGWAIILVVMFHVDVYARFPYSVLPSVSLPLAFVQAGHTGVDLFFVLSAFLLSQPFLADAAGGRRVVLREYAARRALRILPLYWVAVAIGTLATSTRGADLLRGLPYLLFLNSFAGLTEVIAPWGWVWWSLATEVQFYVLLPLLLLVRFRGGELLLGALLVCWAVVYVQTVNGQLHLTSPNGALTLNISVFGRGPLFLWGIAAAAVYRRWGSSLRDRLATVAWLRNGGADAALLALLVALGLFLQWVVSIGPGVQQSAAGMPWHVANGAFWAAILMLLLLAPLRTKPLFANPLIARLGVLSYSIYLIHAPFVFLPLRAIRHRFPGTFAGWQPTTAVVVAALVLGCVGLAELTYRLIERPFLVRKARLDS